MQETSRFRTFSFSPLSLPLRLQLLLFLLSTIWLFPCHRFKTQMLSFPPRCLYLSGKRLHRLPSLFSELGNGKGGIEYFGASYALQQTFKTLPLSGLVFLFSLPQRSLLIYGELSFKPFVQGQSRDGRILGIELATSECRTKERLFLRTAAVAEV